jgi:hypothetical protein
LPITSPVPLRIYAAISTTDDVASLAADIDTSASSAAGRTMVPSGDPSAAVPITPPLELDGEPRAAQDVRQLSKVLSRW